MNKGRREGKKNTALKPTILYGLGAFSGPSRFGESVYIYIYIQISIYIYIYVLDVHIDICRYVKTGSGFLPSNSS